jgi:hypothetical protein
MVNRSVTAPASTRTWRNSPPGCSGCQPVSGGSGVKVGRGVGKGVGVGHGVGEGRGVGVGGGGNKEQPDTRSRIRHRNWQTGTLVHWYTGQPFPTCQPTGLNLPARHLPDGVTGRPHLPQRRCVVRTPPVRADAVIPRKDHERAACGQRPGCTVRLRSPIRG